MLIDCIVKCKVHSVLCQFQLGGLILRFTQVNLKMSSDFSMRWYFPYVYSYYLTVSNGHSLTALSSVKFTQCSGSFSGGRGGGSIGRVNWLELKSEKC